MPGLWQYACENFCLLESRTTFDSFWSLISLIARERIPAKKAIESARKLEFWHVIEDHYLAKGWTLKEFERHIHRLMCDRYLKKGYAV